MIASLPMYDLPEIVPATDRYWALIRDALRDRGIDAPMTLDRDRPLHATWTDPELILSQTCGMPFRTSLKGRVTLVATPDSGLPGVPPGHYFSRIVARDDDPRGLADLVRGTMAYNSADSQSGWAAAVTHLASVGLTPGDLTETGGHIRSLAAVAQGRADYALCDAVTFALLERHRPAAVAGLRTVAITEPTPGLPYITALHRDAAPIRAALSDAVVALTGSERDALMLKNVAHIPETVYLAVPTPPFADQFVRNR
jgi:ABC-type phosphate/phosphonate transport system substrate-binding protein